MDHFSKSEILDFVNWKNTYGFMKPQWRIGEVVAMAVVNLWMWYVGIGWERR